jgi:glycosyltransferase involved in cell wall biosynthesis
MKIGIFTDNDFNKVNGVTTTLRAAVEHAPSDLQLRIYTCDAGGTDTPSYLSFKAFGVGIPFYGEMKMYLPPFARMLREARRARLDAIHLTTPGPVGICAAWVASRLGVPMIGSFHTHLAEYTRLLSGSKALGGFMHWYQGVLYRRCEYVLAPSAATRDMLAAQMNPNRVGIWTRGVSTTRFDPAHRSPALRERWGASDGCPVILYVGRLSREKGLAGIATIRRGLRDRNIAHRFVFVGDGPMGAELRAQHPDAVFTGTLAPDDVAVAMASSDLFVFPSRTDTAGNVVLEAQASGLPVLVTDEGGPKENLWPARSGEICPTVDEMAAHVIALCGDLPRLARMGAEARQYALGRSWESALAPLYRAYRAAATSAAVSAGAAGSLTPTGSPVDEHSSRAPAA